MENEQESSLQRSSFFKILLKQFFNELPIPPAFNKHIAGDLGVGSATLLSPWDGEPFKVKISNDGATLHFAEGWKDFVEAHSLGCGYALVFTFVGNLVFSVKVYDKSTCEVPGRRIKIPADEEEEDQSSGTRVDTYCDSDHKQKRKKSRLMNLKVRRGEFIEFEMEIKQAHFCRPHRLNLSVVLKDTFRLQKRREMILMDSRGRSWPVMLQVAKKGPSGTTYPYFGQGWREFAETKLKVGDKCVFRLVGDGVFKVSVVKDE